jgi:hypothetical protein
VYLVPFEVGHREREGWGERGEGSGDDDGRKEGQLASRARRRPPSDLHLTFALEHCDLKINTSSQADLPHHLRLHLSSKGPARRQLGFIASVRRDLSKCQFHLVDNAETRRSPCVATWSSSECSSVTVAPVRSVPDLTQGEVRSTVAFFAYLPPFIRTFPLFRHDPSVDLQEGQGTGC